MTKEELLYILLSKEVNIRFLKFCAFNKRKGLVTYNAMQEDSKKLTYEEYVAIKELLKEIENFKNRK